MGAPPSFILPATGTTKKEGEFEDHGPEQKTAEELQGSNHTFCDCCFLGFCFIRRRAK